MGSGRPAAVHLVELRVLDGPNLYFTRPAVKVTAAVPGWLRATEGRVSWLAASAGLPGAGDVLDSGGSGGLPVPSVRGRGDALGDGVLPAEGAASPAAHRRLSLGCGHLPAGAAVPFRLIEKKGFDDLVQACRLIREAGGIAIEFPVHPIQETGKRPTAALDRNLAYLGLVEVLYGYPLDGVVLTTGCDKTTPAMLMGAATVNIPAIALSVGPMLNGWFRGERTGSGTIVWKAREMMAAGDGVRTVVQLDEPA